MICGPLCGCMRYVWPSTMANTEQENMNSALSRRDDGVQWISKVLTRKAGGGSTSWLLNYRYLFVAQVHHIWSQCKMLLPVKIGGLPTRWGGPTRTGILQATPSGASERREAMSHEITWFRGHGRWDQSLLPTKDHQCPDVLMMQLTDSEFCQLPRLQKLETEREDRRIQFGLGSDNPFG